MNIPGREQAGRNLITWAKKDEWKPKWDGAFAEHTSEAAELYGISPDELPDLLGPNFVGLFAFVMEDFFSSRFEEGQNIVDSYFARHGWRETVPARRYFEALRDSLVSLYEIVDLDPGHTMTLRDMIRDNAPVVVEEISASQSVALWDCIAARIVVPDEKPMLTGGILYFDRDMANEIQKMFDEMAHNVRTAIPSAAEQARTEKDVPAELGDDMARNILLMQHDAASAFTHAWLTGVLEGLLGPSPEIQNTDGETFMFCDTIFPAKASEEEIAAVLDGIDGLSREAPDELDWVWLSPPGASKRDGEAGADIRNELNQTVLGTISLESGKLALSTNSEERSEKGQALLAASLGERVGPPSTSRRTPQQAREEQSEAPLAEPASPVVPEEMLQALQAHKDNHYRRVLDNPVPALDGKTPRQAASTKEGRAQVIDWLKTLENLEHRHSAGSGSIPYDMRWLWEELGVEHPGR